MIVFDENVHQQRLMETVAAWYHGQVMSITALRAGTIIRDDTIPALLHRVRQPTFVTTNVTDFWRCVPAHSRYSIVCVVLPNHRLHELPALLRRLFNMPEFKTKARRMGKVTRVSHRQIHYYETHAEHIIHIRPWPV
jgi:hypothetical protein